ncbi:carboxymuconolactone decarboxylase family protein [Shewanella avicenniae]|uniref:Carboxymuconolactone decarboxylase family protein n=1 Tax=Shewanella avicenniae TaxID=2814294 RepID=A0ABX7QQX6_9GAMM|nr:carboxymuconolactone decarboxylase family protein [Shewanella avicenniae]QSX33871.1 carboxymuconolactone decarboxylase family protein [Shewanella avicenniae]
MKSDFTPREQAIIPIAAHTANGEIEQLQASLNAGLDAGLTVNEIKEVLVQMYAYTGFPRSLNALGTFMKVLEERKSKGINDTEGTAGTPIPTGKSSLEIGGANQTKLIGQEVKGALFDFAPAIDEYLKAHLFGDIFERGVLSWQDREIATIAALANVKGLNSQLGSHYFISMNNGITPAQLKTFVEQMRKACGDDVANNAAAVLDQVLAAIAKK